MSEQEKCPKCGGEFSCSGEEEKFGKYNTFVCGTDVYTDLGEVYQSDVCTGIQFGRQQARAEIAERLMAINGNFYADYEETYETINSLIAELEGGKQ